MSTRGKRKRLITISHNGYKITYNPAKTDIQHKCVVYCISFTFPDGEQVYIGETEQTLNERITDHCSHSLSGRTPKCLRLAFNRARELLIPVHITELQMENDGFHLRKKESQIIQNITNILRGIAITKQNLIDKKEIKKFISKYLLNQQFTA